MPILAETLEVEIDGRELTDVYDDIALIEVDLDEHLPSMFRLRLPLLLQNDGSWRFLDDQPFRAWNPIVISAGLGGDPQELLSGYVTHVKPAFGAEPTDCSLDIWGLDRSVLMDRKDKLRTWSSMKDSDIASTIFREHGFSVVVDDTELVHDEAISTVIQRETDWRFLRRLAMRNGFECFVDGSTGYFRRTRVDTPPQALLAVHFGDETNVSRFELEVNALAPANVTMFQVDRTSKEALESGPAPGDQPPLGAVGAAQITAPDRAPAVVVVAKTATTGSQEMAQLCRGLVAEREWFVTGDGQVAGNAVGVALKPRATVTIKGIGETYSGVYLVSHVTHSFSEEGYTQTFEVKRNALMPSGSEDFSGSASGLLAGLL